MIRSLAVTKQRESCCLHILFLWIWYRPLDQENTFLYLRFGVISEENTPKYLLSQGYLGLTLPASIHWRHAKHSLNDWLVGESWLFIVNKLAAYMNILWLYIHFVCNVSIVFCFDFVLPELIGFTKETEILLLDHHFTRKIRNSYFVTLALNSGKHLQNI